MPLAKDELSKNAMGGSELMKYRLVQELGEEFLSDFQIFVSRVQEDLDSNRIKIYWHQDMPMDPAAAHLKDGGWEKYDYFVFNSDWQMNMFNLYLGVPYHKSIVLQNAIDPISQSMIDEEKDDEKIRLIYHSTPHRGLNILVPVFEKLAEKHDDIVLDVYSIFKIYGWEDRDKEFDKLFQKCKDHPQINYVGSVPNPEVKKALAKAHIFAYPNTWLETSCIALMEAMSAACVCVHPNWGALYDTSGHVTRMYQYDEDSNRHARRFYGVLEEAIADVRNNRVQEETTYGKIYADTRFTWQRRILEWKAFLGMLKEMKKQGQLGAPKPLKQAFEYKIG
jgi:glycosyltransferase involved in cell wall biosynthesis